MLNDFGRTLDGLRGNLTQDNGGRGDKGLVCLYEMTKRHGEDARGVQYDWEMG